MRTKTWTAILVGVGLGVGSTLFVVATGVHGTSGPDDLAKLEAQLATLQADVERLKKVVPDQSHAMQDVDYHFTNLWFAARASNWPLADFYWKETLSHLRWAMRIIPVRKDHAGRDVNVQSILEGFEKSTLMELGNAIEAKDPVKFEAQYKQFLEACYTCHTTAEKPYLRPQVPEQRTTGMINLDPQATWPK